MDNFELGNFSVDELKKLKKEIEKAIFRGEAKRKAEALAKVEAVVRETGFTITELFGQRTERANERRPAKYRHPEDSQLTWSGQGRKPNWFTRALANGSTPDDLYVK